MDDVAEVLNTEDALQLDLSEFLLSPVVAHILIVSCNKKTLFTCTILKAERGEFDLYL